MHHYLKIIFIGGLVYSAFAIAADNLLDNALIREQQRQRELSNQEQRRHIPGGSNFALPQKGKLADSNCFDVKELHFKNASLLPKKQKARLKKRWQGRCIALNDINLILRDVSEWYVQKGYVTTRAFVQPQDISQGRFEVLVMEGKIENYLLQDKAGLKRRQVYTAFPAQPGAHLHIRDLEQGTDQINRAGSKNISIQMLPGTEPGGTIVGLGNQASKPWWLGYELSNDGGKATGDLMHRFKGGFDNLLGINDVWLFGVDYSNRRGYWDAWDLFDNNVPDYYYKPSEPKGRSIKYWGSLSIPFRRWTLGLDASRYEYANSILHPAEEFDTRGRSYSISVGLDRVLYRDQLSKTWLEADFTLRDSESYVEDTLVRINDRRTSTATLALNHSRTFWKGVLNGRLAYHRGLNWFNANGNEAIAGDDGLIDYNFNKVSLDLDYMRPFKINNQQWVYTGHIYGQYSPDILPGSDRLGLGGYYSIRGFDDASLAGDTGFYFRNELTWNTSPKHYPKVAAITGRISPWLGLDVGGVWGNGDDKNAQGWLVGAAVGVKGQGAKIGKSHIHWGLTMSYPLYFADDVKEHRDVRFHFNIGFTY